ncbi:MAG: peptide chain release factor N(5)-glutamine methyltransferase [Candidatus Doudnabacteria bacterium]|nr:peptide chain release factor N(5)-glutamine methyltransferase [Candidatus Doudnabacteria bacterium]
MIIQESLSWAIKTLHTNSSSPALDAEVLLCHVRKCDKTYLYANPHKKISKLQTTHYQLLIRKRARHWPIAYLTGHKEFFGLDFVVTPDVLIPRPETELLVELALEILKAKSYNLKAVIDLGTGSGNIIISLGVIARGLRRSNLKFFATDSSPKALRIAKLNARRHGVAKKIKFLRGNLLSPLLKTESYKLKPNTLILANLPYLTPARYSSNPDLKYEPKFALVEVHDGLKHFLKLFQQLSRHCEESALDGRRSNPREIATLRPRVGARNDTYNITLILEHDSSQKPLLAKLAKKYFPHSQVVFYKDLAGRWRVMKIKI